MSHLDISEIAGQIIADAQAIEQNDLQDAITDLFMRLTEGLSETAASLVAVVINRRLGLVVV